MNPTIIAIIAVIITAIGIILGLLPYLRSREKDKLQLALNISAHSHNSCQANLTVFNRSHEPLKIIEIKAFSSAHKCMIGMPVTIERGTNKTELYSAPREIFEVSTTIDPEDFVEFPFFVVSREAEIAGVLLTIEIRTSASLFSINPRRKQITAMYNI